MPVAPGMPGRPTATPSFLTEAARHLQAAMLVIDGLFGIGLSRPL